MKAYLSLLLCIVFALLPHQARGAYFYAAASAGGGGNGLLTDLQAYWKLDEASGTRDDAHSTNDLTDNNTVTQNTGALNSAAEFVSANSESLSIADNAALSLSDVDWFVSLWVYRTAAATRALFGKGTEYNFEHNGSGQIDVFTANNYRGTTTFSISSSTWTNIQIWFDSATDTIYLSKNGAAAESMACPPANDGTGAFSIGVLGVGSPFYDGRIDEFYFRKGSICDATQRGLLYGSGTPPDYSTFSN